MKHNPLDEFTVDTYEPMSEEELQEFRNNVKKAEQENMVSRLSTDIIEVPEHYKEEGAKELAEYERNSDPLGLAKFTMQNEKTGAVSIADSLGFNKTIAESGIISVTKTYPDGVYYDETTKVWITENVQSYIATELIPEVTKHLGLATYLSTAKRNEAAKEILEIVKRKALFKDDPFNIATAKTKEVQNLVFKVPFKNGTYDFITNEIHERSQYDYVTTSFNCSPKPNNRTPKIVEWLEYLCGDSYKTLCQYVGFTFVRDYSPLNNLLIATDSKSIGVKEGGNGKSQVFKLLSKVFASEQGISNTSAITLEQLSSNKSSDFLLGELRGKYANFNADSNSNYLKDTSILKSLTGGDEIRSDVKYSSPISFHTYAKLYFGINELPNYSDNSDGFRDRLAIVAFIRNLRDDEEQRNKANSIYNGVNDGHNEHDINEFVWYCLQEWRKLWIVDGKARIVGKLPLSDTAKHVLGYWDEQNNKYSDFWGEQYVLTENPDDRVSAKDLHAAMKEYLIENGYKIENAKTAKKAVMKDLLLKTYNGKANDGTLLARLNKKPTKVYRGVKEVTESEFESDLTMEMAKETVGEITF